MDSVEDTDLEPAAPPTQRCDKSFQVWIAFIFGMACMVLVVGLFDRVVKQTGFEQEYKGSASLGWTASGQVDAGAWIGVEVQDLSVGLASQLGLEEVKGVLVTKVYPGSPAEEADIRRDDVIVSFNRQKIQTVEDLETILTAVEPGDRVRACLYRDGARVSIYVAPIQRPASTVLLVAGGEEKPNITWGMTISPLTPDLQTRLSIPEKVSGVVVTEVSPNGLADRGGVEPGDLIRSVNRRRTGDMASFFKVLDNAAEGMLLDIYRRGQLLFLTVGDPNMPAPQMPASIRTNALN